MYSKMFPGDQGGRLCRVGLQILYLLLTLELSITITVVCFCHLLVILKVIFANIVDPDQIARSLIWVHTVCLYAKIGLKNLQEYSADNIPYTFVWGHGENVEKNHFVKMYRLMVKPKYKG